jgi:hypothetical protein
MAAQTIRSKMRDEDANANRVGRRAGEHHRGLDQFSLALRARTRTAAQRRACYFVSERIS